MAKIDFQKFRELEEAGYISIRKHPSIDLYILNYTAACQYNQCWTPETMMARGLIVDSTGEILARPFKKFFNLGEDRLEVIPNGDFEVQEKMDGSLGILYWIEDQPMLASRGSFTSEQAMRGTELLGKYDLSGLEKEYTYLFEIIYPENRIVVDYEGEEKLVLLAKIDTETGEELFIDGLPFERPKIFDVKTLADIHSYPQDDSEGFVLKWTNGFRLKYKFSEYVRLHKLLTACTARDIWKVMKDGVGVSELLEKVPDEFYKWIKAKTVHFQTSFQAIHTHAKMRVKRAREEVSFKNEWNGKEFLTETEVKAITNQYKKEVRKHFIDPPEYEYVCWAVFNKNRDLTNELIWKLLYPEHEKPFKQEIE